MATQFSGTRRKDRDLIDITNERDEITDNDFRIIKTKFMVDTGLRKQIGDIDMHFTGDTGCLGWYDIKNKSITMSSTMLESMAEKKFLELYERYQNLQDYKMYIYNYARLLQIYYALAHVLIEQNPDVYSANLPRAINKGLFELSMEKMREYKEGIVLFDDRYKLLPTEVFAYNYAVKRAYAIMSESDLEKRRLLSFRCDQLETMLSYYETGRSPLDLSTDGCYDSLGDISNISYKDRAFSGLPLEGYELARLSDERDAYVKKIL